MLSDIRQIPGPGSQGYFKAIEHLGVDTILRSYELNSTLEALTLALDSP